MAKICPITDEVCEYDKKESERDLSFCKSEMCMFHKDVLQIMKSKASKEQKDAKIEKAWESIMQVYEDYAYDDDLYED